MRSSIPRFTNPAAALVALAVLGLLAADASAGKPKSDGYLHPQYASFQVRSIGVLPLVTLAAITPQRREDDPIQIVRSHVERALAPTGYRFMEESQLRAATRATGADSLLRALETSWRKSGVLDSTALKATGQARVVDAMLGVMVTTWERNTIAYDVVGQSITQIAVLLALYSTRTGELLWRDSFLEKGEGPYNNPDEGGSNVTGVASGALGTSARTSTSLEPPSFDEVATKLEQRIQRGFPPPPKSAPKGAPLGKAEPSGL
jgi:hypothetical protein